MQTRKNTLIRQKEIVLAARKLIVKYGSEHITIRRIAQEIGVTEGAIYKHFRSKRDVLAILIDDVENTLISDIEENYSSGTSALQSLENILVAHVSGIEQRRGVTFQVIAEIISLGNGELNQKIYLTIDRYVGKIKAILADGVRNGLIDLHTDLEAAARLFFSLIQGLVTIWALGQNKFDLINSYKPVWELFVRAIARQECDARLQERHLAAVMDLPVTGL